AETSVKSAEPTATTRWVRRPAPRSRSSRSSPIAPPSTAATASRRRTSGQPRLGMATLRELTSDGLGLVGADLGDPGRGELEQLVERLARERVALGGGLHLDQPAVAGHYDVHVRIGCGVLVVVQVEQRHPADDAHRDGGDRAAEGAREPEALERTHPGDVRAADRRAAGAAVGLQHVAVEPYRPLA